MRRKNGQNCHFMHHFLHHHFKTTIQSIEYQQIKKLGCHPASSTTFKANCLIIRQLAFLFWGFCACALFFPVALMGTQIGRIWRMNADFSDLELTWNTDLKDWTRIFPS